jgi:predicted peroxiredoxin
LACQGPNLHPRFYAAFLIAVFSLSISQDVNVRLVIVIVGILVSLGGIIGLINPAAMKNAVWRK